MLRMIVNNHALMLVPTLYFSWFAKALYRVSWYKSLAVSLSFVRLTAKGLRKSAFSSSTELNSFTDILFKFNAPKVKQNRILKKIFFVGSLMQLKWYKFFAGGLRGS